MENIKKDDLIVGVIASVVFIIIGFVLLYFGFKIHNKVTKIRKYGIKTVGKIIRYERRRGTKTNDYIVIPIVTFHTNSGEKYTIEGHVDNTSILQNLCKVGKEVEIVYNPNNPKDAIINTFGEIWFGPILFWLIGFAFVAGPPFTLWKYYHEQGVI